MTLSLLQSSSCLCGIGVAYMADMCRLCGDFGGCDDKDH